MQVTMFQEESYSTLRAQLYLNGKLKKSSVLNFCIENKCPLHSDQKIASNAVFRENFVDASDSTPLSCAKKL